MKIGLFVTGHFRNAPNIPENYKQFLDGHDTSVYVATWSSKNISRDTHQIDHTPVDVEATCKLAFGNSLKDVWVGNMEAFLNNQPPTIHARPRMLLSDYINPDVDPIKPQHPWPQRVVDQWYAVLQAYLMARDVYDTFDMVIRIRGDQSFLDKPLIPLHEMDAGIHVNGYTWWHNPEDREGGILADSTNLVPYALSDQLAWGSPYWMKKYFEYYLHYFKLYAGRINVWHGLGRDKFDQFNSFLFNSEHMMSYYLLKYPYYYYSPEYDMPWHRHGHDSDPNNRFNADYYYYDPPQR